MTTDQSPAVPVGIGASAHTPTPARDATTAGDPIAALEKIAASIYDHPTSKHDAPGAEKVPEQKPTPDDVVAQKLYGPKPQPGDSIKVELDPAIVELRESDSKIHDATHAFDDVIRAEDIGDETATPEQKAAAAREYKAMLADVGVSNVEAKEVVTLVRQFAKTPPTDAENAEYVRTSIKWLMDINNQDEKLALADLQLAKALMKRDPRMRALVNSNAAGNHPRVVEIAVQLGRKERAAGRLK
jgi:hypothetical protein